MELGRKPKYATAEELEKEINQYFDSCAPEPLFYEDEAGRKHVATDKQGKAVILFHYATMAGLAFALGYSSRQAIYDLENKNGEFSYIIKRARLKIEANHEECLSSRDKPVGNIFWLKNHGWTDRQSIDHSGEINSITLKIIEPA